MTDVDPTTVQLSDGVVLLRPYTLADAPALTLRAQSSWHKTVQWMPWCHEDYQLAEAEAWIGNQLVEFERRAEFSFMVRNQETMEPVGGCGINQIDWMYRSANLGYWTALAHRGKGYSVRSTNLLLRFAFEVLELERIEIVVAGGNRASMRVAKKVGAVKEGRARHKIKIGEVYHDAMVHSVLKGEFLSREQ